MTSTERPSYAVDVEPSTGLIIKPFKAHTRPTEVDYMAVIHPDLPSVLAWLRTLNVQFIVHTGDYGLGSVGPDHRGALTLWLRGEAHTADYGDVLVLAPGPGPAWQRLRIHSRAEFRARYTAAT